MKNQIWLLSEDLKMDIFIVSVGSQKFGEMKS